MSSCSSRALTLLSSVFGACGLLLVGIAVSTDHWLYMEEGVVLPQNQSTEVRMALHAGLWRVCFFAGTRGTVRTATPFPMVSLFLVFTAFVISNVGNVGHIRPQRTLLAFVSGIFFILSGEGAPETPPDRPQKSPQHRGRSVQGGAGVLSVYLFTKRYAEEEPCRAPAALLRPRLSACSGLSGQFLQPRAWPRARSPSDASSDVSIQMTQSYPPAIQSPPPRGRLSTSPC
uniref:Calcium voltage-gated channel auxiliary subunit gamma 7 n=1 Tax=Anas zonorhyncha TaxID=75864 RepID=A0A8B9ZU97_9AVES